MSEKTATQIAMERQPWLDLRRMRAQQMTARVMQVLGDTIQNEARREAHYRLFDAFIEAGIDFITDADREAAGLEPRGELGYTSSELQAMEAHRIKKLLEPLFTTPLPKKKE
ncbi:MAG: hypothetical protein OJI67_10740 [Prosthecobacter sp.]|nr:hypothetical protein [Prosthecobacter sp.]